MQRPSQAASSGGLAGAERAEEAEQVERVAVLSAGRVPAIAEEDPVGPAGLHAKAAGGGHSGIDNFAWTLGEWTIVVQSNCEGAAHAIGERILEAVAGIQPAL